MRGPIDFARSARCRGCKLPAALCVCDQLPHIELPVQFIFLRHVAEWNRQSNTGELAHRMLAGSLMVDYGVRERPLDVAPFLDPLTDYFVLFPRPGGEPPSPERVLPRPGRRSTLVLLDSHWRSARRMFARVPALHPMPVLTLPPRQAPPRVALRRAPSPAHYFTLAAVVETVRLLGFESEASILAAATTRVVERMLMVQGRLGRGKLARLQPEKT